MGGLQAGSAGPPLLQGAPPLPAAAAALLPPHGKVDRRDEAPGWRKAVRLEDETRQETWQAESCQTRGLDEARQAI